MANWRLVLLHWKMQVRAWLEALWEERWFGIALTSLFTAGCFYLQWNTPGPGVSVAVMGVAAAVMTARAKASGPEKAVWMLIITSLLISEVLALRKDRREHDNQIARVLSEEVGARREAKTNFEGIGGGIKAAISQSEDQFEETVSQQSHHFDATMKKEQMNFDALTGGDSYAVVIPDFMESNTNTFPLLLTGCDKCQYGISNPFVYLQTHLWAEGLGDLIFHETITIDPSFSAMIPKTVITASWTEETICRFIIISRNKPTSELLRLRYNQTSKLWEFTWKITRQLKRPHRNPKTKMAEGEVLKVLDERPWDTLVKTTIDRSKTIMLPKQP
jgi:hypothetical protein